MDTGTLNRRAFVVAAGAACLAYGLPLRAAEFAAELADLEVASAGSFGPFVSGPAKQAAAQTLQLDLHSHAQGADAVAKAIVDASLVADVFIPITAGPMHTVLKAGKAATARAIAQTEMVIVYSPKSRFVAKFEAAAAGKAQWWEVLQEPRLRFTRSNPAGDPGGRNVIFTMMLAAKKYGQADLMEKVLGPVLNPAQILVGGNNRARLQTGEIDASASYKVGPRFDRLPYLELPKDVNLSGLQVHAEHPDVQFTVGDKTFYPEPLVFYAAILKGATHVKGAAAFVDWLCGPVGQALLRQYHFDDAAGVADLPA